MIIKVLVENTKNRDELACEHGLSLYIETEQHRLLFDAGQTNIFEENAKALGVDLKTIDTLILSHGHYDHGGGLPRFLEINHRAKVYIKEDAFKDFYSTSGGDPYKYIGLDKQLQKNEQVVLVEKDLEIDEELSLYTNISGNLYFPSCNKRLYTKENDQIIHDDFNHEQNLVIRLNDYRILIAGCAHNGIVNIIEAINQRLDQPITHVISGFHMYSKKSNKSEDPDIVNNVGKYLQKLDLKCYTGHCTGDKAYGELKEILDKDLFRLSTGNTIIIE